MRRAFLLTILALAAARAFADGGQIILHQSANDLEITVFAVPSPLTTGDAELSVLLQDSGTHHSILNSEIALELQPPTGPSRTVRPSTSPATNRLSRAAPFHFDQAGLWTITVTVRYENGIQSSTAKFPVAASHSRGLIVWICLLIPPFVVVLFALHQRQKYLSRRTLREVKAPYAS